MKKLITTDKVDIKEEVTEEEFKKTLVEHLESLNKEELLLVEELKEIQVNNFNKNKNRKK
jgi:hypothetical protein